MSTELRKLVNDFDGNTKLIGRLVQQLGGYIEFAKHYKGLSAEREQALEHNLRAGSTEINPPNIGIRMENIACQEREQAATDMVKERLKIKSNVKHDEAKQVLKDWYGLKIEIDGSAASQADSSQYVAELFEKTKRFLADAQQRRDTIHGKKLATVRYRDSLAEVDSVIKLATSKLDSLGKRFEALSGPMTREEQNMVPSAKDLAIYKDTVDRETGKPVIDQRNRGGQGPTQEERLQTVEGRLEAMSATGVRTESQAWSLVGAEKKGEAEQPVFRLKALERLELLNKAFGTSYSEPHLDLILDYIANQKLATNYWFSKKPGENIDKTQSQGTPLYQLLTDPSNKHFKNVWETGKSQASTELDRRGGVEEAMGYSGTLKRQYESNSETTVNTRKMQPASKVPKKATWDDRSEEKRGDIINSSMSYTLRPDDGSPNVVKQSSQITLLDQTSADAPKKAKWTDSGIENQGEILSKEVVYTLRPDDGSPNVEKKESEVTVLDMFDLKDKGEMPKYAALVDERQKEGVSPRYGDSFIIWKEAVRQRVTHTPGDSWNTLDEGVKYFTSNKHPEVLVANADVSLIRLAAAACTGQDTEWLSAATSKGIDATGYMETQIHGDLTWDDVDTVVVGGADRDSLYDHFEKFSRTSGYKFSLKKK
jgi:hypothetical protein